MKVKPGCQWPPSSAHAMMQQLAPRDLSQRTALALCIGITHIRSTTRNFGAGILTRSIVWNFLRTSYLRAYSISRVVIHADALFGIVDL